MNQNLGDKKAKGKRGDKESQSRSSGKRERAEDKDSKGGPSSSMFMSERLGRLIEKTIGDREFESEEEMATFVEGLSRRFRGRGIDSSWATSPKEKAQELAYQAIESDDLEEVVSLVQEALNLDPRCVDALLLLATVSASNLEEKTEYLERVVEIAEEELGEEYFMEGRGHFWGMVATRPYMRARQALAGALNELGRLDEAAWHYEAMLDLNPSDNQGLRYSLLAIYLSKGDLEGARWLFQKYERDTGAFFKWGKVLERYLSHDLDGAAVELQEARETNRFVEAYLVGKKRLPDLLPDHYEVSGESEAVFCALDLGQAWEQNPSAVSWLKEQTN